MRHADVAESVVLVREGDCGGRPTEVQQNVADLVYTMGACQIQNAKYNFQIVASQVNAWLDRLTLYFNGELTLDMMETNQGSWILHWYRDSPDEDLVYLYIMLLSGLDE